MNPPEIIEQMIMEGSLQDQIRFGVPLNNQQDIGIWILPSGGFPPEPQFGCSPLLNSTVQVQTRGCKGDQKTPYELARTIKGLGTFASVGESYSVRPLTSDPLPLGIDDQGRYGFSINFVVSTTEP